MGDGLGVTEGPEDAVDPSGGDGSEEVLEVEMENDRPPGVDGGVGPGRPAGNETVAGA
jgi:hypothetical protein